MILEEKTIEMIMPLSVEKGQRGNGTRREAREDALDADNLGGSDSKMGQHHIRVVRIVKRTSQKMMLRGTLRGQLRSGSRTRREGKAAHEIKFLVRMRGVRTLPPRMDAPVIQMPLRSHHRQCPRELASHRERGTHHPAPTTLRPMFRPMPINAQAYGLVSSRNAPGLNWVPDPVKTR